jgi:cytochrome P450
MDVIADLASPLSTLVMSDLLGLPEMDHIRCQQWAEALFFQQPSDVALFNEHEAENEYQFSQAHAALQEMTLFFQQLLAERHFHPQDDLISHLLATEVEGTRLRQGEILSFCLLLFLAGQVTTTHLLGQCLLCLDAHPEALYQLRADPTRIPGAIEEVLRFAPPVWRILRYTRAEVEIAGACLPANAKIFAWLASANRDERSFSSPRSFDIARVPHPPHLSFGQGVHFCLGAPLARLETSIALSLLLTQLPNLRVVKDPPLELLGSHVVFGVKRLPVTFTPGTI